MSVARPIHNDFNGANHAFMQPYLGPPWTDSHQIWTVEVFHQALPIGPMVFKTLKCKKKKKKKKKGAFLWRHFIKHDAVERITRWFYVLYMEGDGYINEYYTYIIKGVLLLRSNFSHSMLKCTFIFGSLVRKVNFAWSDYFRNIIYRL